MKFDIISVVFLLIILLYVIRGFKKGFINTVLKFLKGLISLVVAIIVAKPLANFLFTTPVGEFFITKLNDGFVSKGEIFNTIITSENKDLIISGVLTEMNIPTFISNFISSYISSLIVVEENVTIAHAFATSLTQFILIVIGFLAAFVVTLILVFIISKIFKVIENLPIVGALNRLVGGVFSGLIGLFIVSLITFLISLILPFSNEFASWYSSTIMLDDPNTFTFAKFIYENNFIAKLIELINTLK